MSAADRKHEPLAVRPKEAALMIGFSKSKLYMLIADGEIRTFKIGRATFIDVLELRAYLERMKGGRAA